MWLINASDFSLREVHETGDSYSYAILSHTWDECDDDPWHKEVTFQDMRDLAYAQRKSGWQKIEQTCRLAREKGLKWTWVDTCCIDKSSSAELSEAINSMFRWYQEATICIVYLSDLHQYSSADDTTISVRQTERLSACRWFTRGWTLQELIAPAKVEFYTADWGYFGTKTTLERLICQITGVDVVVLRDREERFDVPVAQRMRWASRRKTKRTEDIAYSLLGIFDINMPLIYGEGKKAFIRLQNAILQQADDTSIFAWSIENTTNLQDCAPQKYYGLFAESPHCFRSFANLRVFNNPELDFSCSFTSINRELRFNACLSPDHVAGDYALHLLFPKNSDVSNGGYKMTTIHLVKTTTGYARYRPDKSWASVFADELVTVWYTHSLRETFTVPKTIDLRQSSKLEYQSQNALRIQMKDANYHLETLTACLGPLNPGPPSDSAWIKSGAWDTARTTFVTENNPNFTGLLTLGHHSIHTLSESWLQNIRILCGLRREQSISSPDLPPQSIIEPWACFIHQERREFEVLNGHFRYIGVELFSEFRALMSGRDETFSSLVPRLRRYVQLSSRDFRGLPTKIRVIPRLENLIRKTINGEEVRLPRRTIDLTLQPERKEKDGVVTHVITLLVEESQDEAGTLRATAR